MSKKRFYKVQPKGISTICSYLNRGKWIVEREYQRNFVWTLSQKQLLIDSILQDIDIPKVYLAADVDPKINWEIVDGQQRLLTIQEFVEGKFKTDLDTTSILDVDVAGKYFQELDSAVQDQFNDYQITCVELYDHSRDEIKDIFVRHQNGETLRNPEIRRALPGSLPKIIGKLSQKPFFKNKNLLSFKDSRADYADICDKGLYEISSGQIMTTSHSALKKFYTDMKNISPTDASIKKLENSLNFLHKAFKDSEIGLTKNDAKRLIYLVSEFLDNYIIKGFEQEFCNSFKAFKAYYLKELESTTPNKDIESYQNAARNDSPPSQIFIHEYLTNWFLSDIQGIKTKPAVRRFTDAQRRVLLHLANNKCQICTKDINLNSMHADHVKAYSNGGETSIKNGQALCSSCNQSKGNS
tara:strand:- start:97 stop:1329 length:1233 start_codon:yes stop_codon:yes gene_type:complete